MDNKTSKIKAASDNIKQIKIVLYHVLSPISDQDFAKIENSGYFDMSNGALGGQSNGYYFFTTRFGADYHVKNMRDSWDFSNNKHAYIVECEIDSATIKYPDWKLDYESTQDFLFDMIYDAAHEQPIRFDNIKIDAVDNKKLAITNNGVFSRISEFSPDIHSGLVEKTSDFLYNHNKTFRMKYDELLQNVFNGIGNNLELYAVKTTHKHKITKTEKIQDQPTNAQTVIHSQINKFWSRYGRK